MSIVDFMSSAAREIDGTLDDHENRLDTLESQIEDRVTSDDVLDEDSVRDIASEICGEYDFSDAMTDEIRWGSTGEWIDEKIRDEVSDAVGTDVEWLKERVTKQDQIIHDLTEQVQTLMLALDGAAQAIRMKLPR